jgi:hypothetical protein
LFSSEEIKRMLENKIEEKRKEVSPHQFNQAYVEHANTELETLQSLWAEISDTEIREKRELSKQQNSNHRIKD